MATTGSIARHAEAASRFYPHPDVRFVALDGPPVEIAVATRATDDRHAITAVRHAPPTRGMIVVLLSTVAVPVIHELAAVCAAAGVFLLDCGVTLGDKAAENGMVAILGGDAEVIERARPVLADFAKRVVHCGPLGAGMATKIARNVVTYGSWTVVHEAVMLARAAGVDPATTPRWP